MQVRKYSGWRCRGAAAVETAIVLPVVLMFTIGLCIFGLGVYRYQQVATLAREGARYASVRGSQYYQNVVVPGLLDGSGNKAVTITPDLINTNAIAPLANGLNGYTYTIYWGTSANATNTWDFTQVWTDSSTSYVTSYNANSTPAGVPYYNAVKVVVSYSWTPGLYVTGPITLTSTSVMPMSY